MHLILANINFYLYTIRCKTDCYFRTMLKSPSGGLLGIQITVFGNPPKRRLIKMALQDKTLTCKDCDSDFVFSASEQEFYAEKGFQNEPQRCPSCRKVRKQRTTSNSSSGGQRQMFSATCSSCGVQTQVPFKPNGTKPVYCRDCFQR